MVNEPDEMSAISILRGLKERYENHHQVRIRDEAIIAAVQLSERYITDRFLPDKAIDLVDEAASKLRLERDSVPQALDEITRKIAQLEIEREAIKREGDNVKIKDLEKELADLRDVEKDFKANGSLRRSLSIRFNRIRLTSSNLILRLTGQNVKAIMPRLPRFVIPRFRKRRRRMSVSRSN